MGRLEAVPVGRKGGPEGSLTAAVGLQFPPGRVDAGPCARTSLPAGPGPRLRGSGRVEAAGRCRVRGSRREGPGPAGDERAVAPAAGPRSFLGTRAPGLRWKGEQAAVRALLGWQLRLLPADS